MAIDSSANTSPSEVRCDSTYIVYETLKNHLLPKTLWLSGKLTIDQVKYALVVLRRNKIIARSGRAWIVLKDTLPEGLGVKKTHRVGMRHTPPVTPNFHGGKIRGHGFQFTLRLPKLQGWEDRKSVLERKSIPYVNLEGQHSQRLDMDNVKIWLCPHSIVFYLGKTSFYSDKPCDAGQDALDFTLKIIRKLENLMGIGSEHLKTGKGYWIKVSRSHYAIIHDGLAKRMDKRKIYVYDEKGLWFLIDNSFNLHEAEFVRAETNVDEATFYKNIWLNDLNKTRLTPSATLAAIKRVEDKADLSAGVAGKLANVENILMGGLPTQNAMANSLNLQAVTVQGIEKILGTLTEKVLTLEALKDNHAVKVEILEDTGEFMGLTPFTYEEHVYNLEKGSIITMETETANALIMNRKARIMNRL